MTVLPSITTFANGAGTGAAAVYSNDSKLVGAFGSLEVSDSISNDNSEIGIRPISVALTTGSGTIFRWTVSADVTLELWELHIAPQPALDGSTNAAVLDVNSYFTISVKNDGVVVAGAINVLSPTVSYTKNLSASASRTVSSGDDVEFYYETTGSDSKAHLSMTVLAYTQHRE